ncbi:hypothetical protein [Salinarimonas ramus]|uniref:Uncharacterized protein n=1 Tax=Salinarimonas ramus TaxID=690164 RepID=A0A917V668_9HYPH|nr:hypothetical protein [Salinarimonas ramus]GGK43164.1 hypothetical protein GCM10011322_32910 [Salinarimonas ramus]
MTKAKRTLLPTALAASAGLAGFALAFSPSQERTSMTLAVAPAHAHDHAADAAPYAPWLPTGFVEAARRGVTVDGAPATLVRHVRVGGVNAVIGGEHVSAVVGENGRLKGYARMEASLADGALPTREEARTIAMDFLARVAPELRDAHRLSWIEPHDEPLRVADAAGTARDLTVTGMKVKMRSTADGLWFWVIVGADREVMVFERDIVWQTFPGRRQTEKWLHDTWLVENGYADAILAPAG